MTVVTEFEFFFNQYILLVITCFSQARVFHLCKFETTLNIQTLMVLSLDPETITSLKQSTLWTCPVCPRYRPLHIPVSRFHVRTDLSIPHVNNCPPVITNLLISPWWPPKVIKGFHEKCPPLLCFFIWYKITSAAWATKSSRCLPSWIHGIRLKMTKEYFRCV